MLQNNGKVDTTPVSVQRDSAAKQKYSSIPSNTQSVNSYISVNSAVKGNTQRQILQEILDAKHENYETYRSRSISNSPVGKNFHLDRSNTNQPSNTMHFRASTPSKAYQKNQASPAESLSQAEMFLTQDNVDNQLTERRSGLSHLQTNNHIVSSHTVHLKNDDS